MQLPDQAEFKRLRLKMVDEQLMKRGIKAPNVLKAMQAVPRHLFVPNQIISESYSDSPLPIGFNQTISQPYIVGLMSELIDGSKSMSVLEIGSGSGYQTAILSLLFGKVLSIEIIPELAHDAERRMQRLGLQNVEMRCGDATECLRKDELFDRIMVTAAPEEIPEILIDHLRIRGKMVVPAGKSKKQRLYILTRFQGKNQLEHGPAVRFVPITGRNLS